MVGMTRKLQRQRAKVLAKEHGYLPYMIERYLALWGEEDTMRFIEACEHPPRTAIRMNTLKASVKLTVSRITSKGVQLERVPWLEEGFYADFGGMSPGSLFEHLLGHYYIQGVPSMTVVRTLNPQPGEIVMDLASAPGGKATHIAQLMTNTGLVVAVEQDKLRIRGLESNVYRCGVSNSLILRGDTKKIQQLGLSPNRILLDAPCSGEGLIALDPTRKTSKTMADIRFCATRQDEMLDAAIAILAPGGTLVYSTCSIAPEENEFVIDDMLRKHEDIHMAPIDLDYGVSGYTQPYGIALDESLSLAKRFLPHLQGLEGFFICKIRKEE